MGAKNKFISGLRSKLPVLVEVENLSTERVRLQHADSFSIKNLLLRTSRPLPLGTPVRLQFLFPADPALAGVRLPSPFRGVVVDGEVEKHLDAVDGRVGVQFGFNPDDEETVLLTDIIGKSNFAETPMRRAETASVGRRPDSEKPSR